MVRRTAVVVALALVVGAPVVADARHGIVHVPTPPAPHLSARSVELGPPPDVVLVLTDDQRPDTLRGMPAVRRLLVRRGTRFSRVVAPTATCCPSRASIVTGRFPHETGVFGNTAPNGGWRTFVDSGHEDRTLAVALHAQGYRTALVGKYFNGFAQNDDGAPAGHRPPGWDVFLTFATQTAAYLDYGLTDGTSYGSHVEDYSTDVLASRAARFVRRTPAGQPLFLMLTPFAPHKPYRPPKRYRYSRAGELPSYRPPSVTESVRDKPEFLRDKPRVSQHAIDYIRARQQEALLAVDDAVARVVRALRRSGRLENTLLVFMSDNGFLVGDHHTIGKNMPYRFATDVPVVVRWDGRIAAGVAEHRLAATVDVTETIARAARTTMTTSGLDLLGPGRRTEVVVEGRTWHRRDGSTPHPAYCGVRTRRHLFVRWADGFEELYDHRLDPWETTNRAGDPARLAALTDLRERARSLCVPEPPGFSWTPRARSSVPQIQQTHRRSRPCRSSRTCRRRYQETTRPVMPLTDRPSAAPVTGPGPAGRLSGDALLTVR